MEFIFALLIYKIFLIFELFMIAHYIGNSNLVLDPTIMTFV